MSTLDLNEPDGSVTAPESVASTGHPVGRLAGFIDRSDPGTRAALARLNPDELHPHQIAALTRALIYAGLSPDSWKPATWKRWALISHGMALTGHGNGSLGKQLADASVSEPRITKLLVSHGDAFLQMIPRLLRLLASKQTHPNWYTLSELIRKNDAQEAAEQEEVEELRLRIAGDYFSATTRFN
jgi:CRISPR system Cascade subunit CasB